jgi:hypothetical protein
MERLRELVAQLDGFEQAAHAEKLRFFAWALHEGGKEHVGPADLNACYRALHIPPPGNLHRAVQALEQQRDLLKSAEGYRLSKSARDRFAARVGRRKVSVQIHDLLAGLTGQMSTAAQRDYLDEALRCFRAEAWRAAVIMSWNVAFDHLCEAIVSTKLADFNRAFPTAFPKLAQTIVQRADLRDVKESVVIKVSRTANIVDKTQFKCLERSLDIRNDAAHPSGAGFNQPKAEAYILDVVETIVLGVSA